MILWIFVAMFVGGLIWAIVADYYNNACGIAMSIVSVLVIIIMVAVLICNYAGLDGTKAQLETRRESLVFQYEHRFYENDNDIGKKELMDDIQAWNEMIVRKQETQDNFWTGIFIPNIYDEFEPIELTWEVVG